MTDRRHNDILQDVGLEGLTKMVGDTTERLIKIAGAVMEGPLHGPLEDARRLLLAQLTVIERLTKEPKLLPRHSGIDLPDMPGLVNELRNKSVVVGATIAPLADDYRTQTARTLDQAADALACLHTHHATRPVLQDWVRALPFMQQSVLLTGLRAPDTLAKNHPAKRLMRWYRRCILVCAFCKKVHTTPDEWCEGSFTGPLVPRDQPTGEPIQQGGELRPYLEADRIARDYLVNVDEIPHHFHLHLLHGAQIIGNKHPDRRIDPVGVAMWWERFYSNGVNDMHLHTESEAMMDDRLSGVPALWKARETFPADTEGR